MLSAILLKPIAMKFSSKAVRVIVVSALALHLSVAADKPVTAIQAVKLSDTTLSIDKSEAPVPLQIDRLISLLGKPDEVHELITTIRTWNSKGIIARTEPDAKQVDNFEVQLRAQPYDFSPNEFFKGSLTVGEIEITPQTTPDYFSKKGFEPYGDPIRSYKKKIGGISVFVVVEKEQVTLVSLTLPPASGE